MAGRSALAIVQDHLGSPNEAAKRTERTTDALAGTGKMPTPSLVAIAVVSDEDRSRLIDLLRPLNVDVISHESLKTLRTCVLRRDVDLVITDVTLPDGNWVDVLRLTVEAAHSPGILVHSRVVNDRLWSEVLWRGAYDMLVAPYSAEDGRSTIQSALRAGCILAENRPASVNQYVIPMSKRSAIRSR